jgi:hypothetical protein
MQFRFVKACISALSRPAAFSLRPQVHIIVFGKQREVYPFIDCSGAELEHNARNSISEWKTLRRKESYFLRERKKAREFPQKCHAGQRVKVH